LIGVDPLNLFHDPEASKAQAQAAAEKKAAAAENKAAQKEIFDEVLCVGCVSMYSWIHVSQIRELL